MDHLDLDVGIGAILNERLEIVWSGTAGALTTGVDAAAAVRELKCLMLGLTAEAARDHTAVVIVAGDEVYRALKRRGKNMLLTVANCSH